MYGKEGNSITNLVLDQKFFNLFLDNFGFLVNWLYSKTTLKQKNSSM